MIIKHGNGITLSGDTSLGARYVKYAQRKLVELKVMMRLQGSNMINKAYWLNGGCIEIMVRSVAGMDKIHVHACVTGVSCTFKLELVSIVGDDVTVKVSDWNDGKGYDDFGLPAIFVGPPTVYFIDWGDEEGTLISNPTGKDRTTTHQYENTGQGYSISVKGIRIKSTIQVDGEGLIRHNPEPFAGGSLATTHADMLSQSEQIVTSVTPDTPLTGVTTSGVPQGGITDVDGKSNDFRSGYHRSKFTGPPSSAVWLAGRSVFDITAVTATYGKALSILTVDANDQAGLSGSPLKDDNHRCGLYADGVKIATPTRLTMPNPKGSRSYLIPTGTESVELKDISDYAFSNVQSGSLNTVDFWRTDNAETLFIFPYDCVAINGLAVTVT